MIHHHLGASRATSCRIIIVTRRCDDARADAFFLEPAGAPGLRLALARDEGEETPGEENEALPSRGEEDLFAAPLELASAASTRHAPLAFRATSLLELAAVPAMIANGTLPSEGVPSLEDLIAAVGLCIFLRNLAVP